jgi:hypothetical protein
VVHHPALPHNPQHAQSTLSARFFCRDTPCRASCAAQVALRQNKALLGEKGILPVKPYLDGWERSILGQKGEPSV